MKISGPRSFISHVRSMIDRSRLSDTARSVVRQRLTYLSLRKLRRLEAALNDVLRRGVSGDVVEFGVALGGTTIILAERALQSGRNFHGLDVFGMIPAPTSGKDGERAKQRYETIAQGRSQGIEGDLYYGYRSDLYTEVCRSLGRHGLEVDGRRITLHRGLFQDTFSKASIASVAFAHIDCDWYEPVTYCLNAVAELISPNGVIVVDDYHAYDGCKMAVTEFLTRRPDFMFVDGVNVFLARP